MPGHHPVVWPGKSGVWSGAGTTSRQQWHHQQLEALKERGCCRDSDMPPLCVLIGCCQVWSVARGLALHVGSRGRRQLHDITYPIPMIEASLLLLLLVCRCRPV